MRHILINEWHCHKEIILVYGSSHNGIIIGTKAKAKTMPNVQKHCIYDLILAITENTLDYIPIYFIIAFLTRHIFVTMDTASLEFPNLVLDHFYALLVHSVHFVKLYSQGVKLEQNPKYRHLSILRGVG